MSIYSTGNKSKPKTALKPTTGVAVTGRMVSRHVAINPTNGSKPRTAAKSKQSTKARKAAAPIKTSKPRTTGTLKKTAKSRKPTASTKPSRPLTTSKKKAAVIKPKSTAKRQAIPPAKRAKHRVPSTAEKSVVFTLSAPTGLDVSISGSFNNWVPQAMSKGPDELWHITLQLSPGEYQYRFVVDTMGWQDPSNPRKIANEHGGFNSICEVV